MYSGGPVPDLRYASPRGYGGKGCQPYYAIEGRQRHVWHLFHHSLITCLPGSAGHGWEQVCRGRPPNTATNQQPCPVIPSQTFALFASVSR